MKIINEKGKLFGIINPIDLIVVLALIVVVVAVAVKALPSGSTDLVENDDDVVPMEVTLRIRGAMPSLVDAMNGIEPGTNLVAGVDFVEEATVESITIEPYAYTVTNSDGVCVETIDPVKKDIVIVIASEGVPSDPVHKIATQEVRAGRGFTFKTNMVEVNSTIESVIFNG